MVNTYKDYVTVPLPKPLSEYDHSNFNVNQRRAEMIREYLTQGFQSNTQRQLSYLYGVSEVMISKDQRQILKYLSRNYFQKDRVKSTIITAKMAALDGALRDRDWGVVDRITNSLIEFAFNLGLFTKVPVEVELTVTDLKLKEILEKKRRMVEIVKEV